MWTEAEKEEGEEEEGSMLTFRSEGFKEEQDGPELEQGWLLAQSSIPLHLGLQGEVPHMNHRTTGAQSTAAELRSLPPSHPGRARLRGKKRTVSRHRNPPPPLHTHIHELRHLHWVPPKE